MTPISYFSQLKKISSLFLPIKEIHPEDSSFHNAFGERKGRSRVRHRGWINRRAHLFKETPGVSLQTLENMDTNTQIIANFCNLPAQNSVKRFFLIQNIVTLHGKTIAVYPRIHYNKYIKKLYKIINILYKERKNDRKGRYIMNSRLEHFCSLIIQKFKKRINVSQNKKVN